MNQRPARLHDIERERGAVLFLRARNSEKDSEAVRALEQWIGTDDRRRRLIQGMGRLWEGFGALVERPEVESWRAAGLVVEDGVRSPFRSVRPYLALAASLLIAVGIAAALRVHESPGLRGEQKIASAIGERRQFVLTDGSRIVLDAASNIAIDYHSDRRIVRLLHGQARFHVAHDPKRPFHVEAAGDDVRALGTDFNVASAQSTTAVSLIEGSVLVSRLEQRPRLFGLGHVTARVPIVKLRPGQQFSRTANGRQQLRRIDPRMVTAWQEGRLVIENLPLPDAVALANRYSRRTIVIDPQVPPIRLTAVINAGDGLAFAQTVTSYLPGTTLRVSSDRIVIRNSREDFSSGAMRDGQ